MDDTRRSNSRRADLTWRSASRRFCFTVRTAELRRWRSSRPTRVRVRFSSRKARLRAVEPRRSKRLRLVCTRLPTFSSSRSALSRPAGDGAGGSGAACRLQRDDLEGFQLSLRSGLGGLLRRTAASGSLAPAGSSSLLRACLALALGG